MEEMRAAIFEDRFEALYHQLRDVVGEVDLENPTTHPKRKRFKKFSTSGAYEVVALREGVGSIRHIESGEVMHSSEIPLEESRTLYLSQIPFEARCLGASEDTLVVWDVGLGAATNAMAALFAYEDCADKPRRKFLMESFECDFTPLELALLHPDIFPQLWHGAPRKIFEEKKWSSVHEGDFLKTYTAAPRPEIIFYDPFSSKVDSPLWTRACFESLYSVCKGGITWLITYSSSTLVRANLLAAGFFVARGVATGLKKETTIALTPEAYEVSPHLQLLGDEFLERWEKSDAKLPAGLSLDEKVEFEGRIRSHRQFLKKAHF